MEENNIIEEEEKNENNNKKNSNINEEEKENLIKQKENNERVSNNSNEEEKDKLLYQKENGGKINDININIKDKIHAPFLNNNNDNTKINKQEIINNNYENENKIITDYIITIQYTKLLKIPYFIFANIIHFYFPCYKFKSFEIKLSEISTPPFALITTECK